MKKEIIDFLDYMIDKNRIDAFPNAKADQDPPLCTILDHYDSMGWRYFNIRQV